MSGGDSVEVRVAGVLVRDGMVLLVKHTRDGREYWVLPGGHVDFGETLCQALVREFREELSMHVEVGKLAFLNDASPSEGTRHVVNIYFMVDSDDILDKGRIEGIDDAGFYRMEDLLGLDLRPPVADSLCEVISCGKIGNHYLGNLWQ